MREASDKERYIGRFDPFEVSRKVIQTDLGIRLAPDLLRVKVPLGERSEIESELDERVMEDLARKGEDGSGDFLIVQVG